jgi:pimeloyl-ACP methyl ester carboxylesterase
MTSRSTYVLVPGAGGDASYWHLVAPLLRDRGHEVLAPDLPADDDAAGLAEYADVVEAAIDGREGVVLVAQSMGALSAPIVADRLPVAALLLVAPMIPAPGETGGEWWTTSGQTAAQRALDEREGRDPGAPFDPVTTFLHDLPPAVLEQALARPERTQSGTPFADPWPLRAWPEVPTRVTAGRLDRLFPLPFMRRLARERLGLEVDVVGSGHLPALSRPGELVERLEAQRLEILAAPV